MRVIKMNNFGKDLDVIFELGFKRFYIFKNELFYIKYTSIIKRYLYDEKIEKGKLLPFGFILKSNKIYFDSHCIYENEKVKKLETKSDIALCAIDYYYLKRFNYITKLKTNKKELIKIADKIQGKIFYNTEIEIYKISNGSLKIFFAYFNENNISEFVKSFK